MKAFVMITCQQGREDQLLDELKRIEGVKFVHRTFGAYDMIAQIEDDSMEEIQRILNERVRKLESIKSTLTLPENKNKEIPKQSMASITHA